MSLNQVGLIVDLIGAIILAFNNYIKTWVIKKDSIVIGYGEVGKFWKYAGLGGYVLLIVGFVIQFIGSKS